jgi:hypothetical protein
MNKSNQSKSNKYEYKNNNGENESSLFTFGEMNLARWRISRAKERGRKLNNEQLATFFSSLWWQMNKKICNFFVD